MAQPPAPTRYGLITDSEDDFRLSQERIDQQRLATERSNQQKAAEKRRQEALNQHLSKYADDPLSKAVATIEFEKTEAEENRKAQIAARQKEHDKISAKYDDPIAKAWAIMQYDDEQTKNLGPKQAFADREALQRLNEREDTTRKLDWVGKTFGLGIGDAFVRETAGSAVNVVPDLAAVPARAMEAVGLAEPGTADELHRGSEAFQQGRQEARRDDLSPWLSRMYGGASQSALQMAATPGGAASKIVAAGVMSGDAALTTGKDAGLEGVDLARYAGTQGLLEAGVAAIGQKIFGPGIESRMAGQAVAAETMKQLAKNIGKDALKEMPEEVVTSILQDISSKYEGVSPDMNLNDFVANSVDAAVQSALMAGMANAPNAARIPFQKKQPVFPDQQPAEGPNSFTQIPIDEMIQRRDAAAGSQQTIPPEVEAFTANPSRKKYEAAVKAGLPPLTKSTETTRKQYASDLLSDPFGMRKPDLSGSSPPPGTATPPAATPDPATLEPVSETNPETVPDKFYDEVLNLYLKKGDPNGQIQASKNADEAEGQQVQTKELLNDLPAGTQDPAPPADVNESPTPAAHTRESFEAEYLDAIAKQDTPRLADMWDAQPEWANQIEEKQKTSPGVAPGDVFPDQPSSSLADPVSTNEPPKQLTKDEHAKLPMFDVYPLQRKDGTKFAVKEFDRGGPGDAFFGTEDEAKKHADIVRQRSEERAAQLAKDQADEEAAQKKQQEHEASFQGFLTDDPKTKGRRLKTLDTLVNYEKKPITRKSLVEKRVADGWTVNDQDQLQAPTGEFLDAGALTKTGIDYARHLVSKSSNSEKAVPWRRTVDEERPAYNKRLKKEGWTPSPKPDITMISSPGTIKSMSLEDVKKSPYKKGDRVTVITGFSTDEMQIGGEVLEDSHPELPQVKVRVDSGKVHNVMAYYLGRDKPAEKTAETVVPDVGERQFVSGIPGADNINKQLGILTGDIKPSPDLDADAKLLMIQESSDPNDARSRMKQMGVEIVSEHPSIGAITGKPIVNFTIKLTDDKGPLWAIVADHGMRPVSGGNSPKVVGARYGVTHVSRKPIGPVVETPTLPTKPQENKPAEKATKKPQDRVTEIETEAASIADVQAEIKSDSLKGTLKPATDAEKSAEPHTLTHERFVMKVRANEGRFDMNSVSRDIHRSYVEEAIKAGKTVPANVLAEYPDLKPAKPVFKPGKPMTRDTVFADAPKPEKTLSGQKILPGMTGMAEEIDRNEFVRKHKSRLLDDVREIVDDEDMIDAMQEPVGNILKAVWNNWDLKTHQDLFDTDSGNTLWTALSASIAYHAPYKREATIEDMADQAIKQAFTHRDAIKPKSAEQTESDFKAGVRAEIARQLAEEAAAAEAAAKKPPAAMKPAKVPSDKPKAPRKPRTKTGEKLGKLSEDTGTEAKQAFETWLKGVKGMPLNSALGPFNPEMAKMTVTMVRAQVKDKVVKFADLVARVVEWSSPEMARNLSDYIEAAWDILRETDSRLDKTGKVADILGPEKATSDEDTTSTRDESVGGMPIESEGELAPETGGTSTGGNSEDVSGSDSGSLSGRTDSTEGSESDAAGEFTEGNDSGSDVGEKPKPGRKPSVKGSRKPAGGVQGKVEPTNNLRIQPGDTIAPKGEVGKLKANIAAIKLLKTLTAENRPATDDEKRVLMQYTGWGSLQHAFDEFRGNAYIAKPGLAEPFGADYKKSQLYASKKKGEYLSPEELRNRAEAWESKWGESYRYLKENLTKDEFKKAYASVENAHFTSRDVITHGIWGALEQMGVTGGRFMEPSSGIGSLIGLMPDAIANNSEVLAIELDSLTGEMVRKLYPDADVHVKGFEEVPIPPGTIDIAATNVPFHQIGPVDAETRYGRPMNLHNYFIARILDSLRPGGIAAVISTHFTMDANPQDRALLASKADLVGAIRLPNNAFKANAGTEVTTDILFFRKPDGSPFKSEAWQNMLSVGTHVVPVKNKKGVKTGEKTVPMVANEYFANHPEMVLGTHSMAGKMRAAEDSGEEYTLLPIPDAVLADQLKTAVAHLPDGIATTDNAPLMPSLDTSTSGVDGRVEFRNGKLQEWSNKAWVAPLWIKDHIDLRKDGKPRKDVKPATRAAKLANAMTRAIAYTKVRNAYESHIHAMRSPETSDAEYAASQKSLNDNYDAYRKAHGPINDTESEFLERDPGFFQIAGLEIEAEKRVAGKRIKSYAKADVFRERTLNPDAVPEKADSTEEAVKISLAWRGSINLPWMSALTGTPEADLRTELLASGAVFENPETGMLEPADTYLAGNVQAKLRAAEQAVKDGNSAISKNVEFLKQVQPPRASIDSITPSLGENWIGAELTQQWVHEVMGLKDAVVKYNEKGDIWSVSGYTYGAPQDIQNDWGGLKSPVVSLLNKVLNGASTQVMKKVPTGKFDKKGNEIEATVVDEAQTQAAQIKAEKMRAAFLKWAKTEESVIPKIEQAYNEQKNFYVKPIWNGEHLTFPGMSESWVKQIRPYQKNTIWRGIREGRGMIAHGVGAGKTAEIIAIAMEMKRLGTATKPMIVVQNSTLGQFARTFTQIYPTAKVLVATSEDLDERNRAKFMARVATGNWDSIVMAKSTFNEKLPNDPVREQQMVEGLIDELKDILLENALADGAGSPSVKAIQQQITSLEKRLKKIIERAHARQDTDVFFEQMGVDALFLDEAHDYKKPPFVTKLDKKIKGITNETSARALNALIKMRFVQDNNKGRNTFMATGTPITNTLGEAWLLMNMVAPDVTREFGVTTFDRFVGMFATVSVTQEQDPVGKLRRVTRLAKFKNGRQLGQFISAGWDVLLGADLHDKIREYGGGKIPTIKGGKDQLYLVDRSPAFNRFAEFFNQVYNAFKNLEGKDKRLYSWVPISIYGAAQAAAIDIRLVDPTAPDDPGSKINKMVAGVSEAYREGNDKKLTQLIFSDLSGRRSMDKLKDFADGTGVELEAEEVQYDEDGNEIETPAPDTTKEDRWLYQEIKRKLVEQGIPEAEVQIINDYVNPKKPELLLEFMERVNTGEVRIVIGHSDTLGTGVNVQERLWQIWHLDIPMVPAKKQQRDGRGIRSGNMNDEIVINMMAMQKSLDTTLMDMNVRKAKAAEQALSGKAGNEFDDPFSASLMSMQDMQAAMNDDPYFYRKSDLEFKIRNLLLDKEALDQQKSQERWRLRENETNIKSNADSVQHYTVQADKIADILKANHPITVEGKVVKNAAEAEKALKKQFKEQSERISELTQAGTIPALGEYANPKSEHIAAEVEFGPVQFTLYYGERPEVVQDADGNPSTKWTSSSGTIATTEGKQLFDKHITSFSTIMEKFAGEEQWHRQKAKDAADYVLRKTSENNKLRDFLAKPYESQNELDNLQSELAQINALMFARDNPGHAPASPPTVPVTQEQMPKGYFLVAPGEIADMPAMAGMEQKANDKWFIYAPGGFTVTPGGADTAQLAYHKAQQDSEHGQNFPTLTAPAATPDPSAGSAEAPISDARKAANEAKEALYILRSKNARFVQIMQDEWANIVNSAPMLPLTDEMARALAGYTVGSIRAGIKRFDAFIKELRANLDEAAITHVKPNIIEVWNSLRPKYKLDEATDELFDAAMSNTVDVDIEKAVEAAKAAPPAESQNSEPPIAEPSTPTPDPATQPTATGDGAVNSPDDSRTIPGRWADSPDADEPTIGINKAKRAERRKELGLAQEDIVSKVGHSFPELDAQAKKVSPGEAEDVFTRIGAGGEAADNASDRDVFVMLNHYAGKLLATTDTLNERKAAQEAGDDFRVVELDAKLNVQIAEEARLMAIAKNAGTAAGRALAAFKALMKYDMSLARLRMRLNAASDGNPTDAQTQEQIDLHAKYEAALKELEAKTKEAEEAIARAEIAEQIARRMKEKEKRDKAGGKVKTKADRRLDAALEKLGKDLSFFSFTGAFQKLPQLIELAGALIEKNMERFEDFVSWTSKRWGKTPKPETLPVLRQAWDTAWEQEKNRKPPSPPKVSVERDIPDSLVNAAKILFRHFLEEGITNTEEVIDAVHSELQDQFPNLITERLDTMKAMVDYEKTITLSQDPLDILAADKRAIVQLKAKIADMQRGIAPRRSEQRYPASDEQRAHIKMFNEEKRKGGFEVTDPDRQAKSALASLETRLRHSISDTLNEIASGARTVPEKTVQPTSDTTEDLQAYLALVRGMHKDIFGDRTMTQEQRLKAAEAAAVKNEAYWNERLARAKTGDFSTGKTKPDPVTNANIAAIKARSELAKAQVQELKELANPKPSPEAISDARYLTSLQNQLAKKMDRMADIMARAAAGDFAPERNLSKEKREANAERRKKDAAIRDARIKLDETSRALNEQIDQVRKKNLTYVDLAKRVPGAVWATLRDAKLTGELSFILRQGGPRVFGTMVPAGKIARAGIEAITGNTDGAKLKLQQAGQGYKQLGATLGRTLKAAFWKTDTELARANDALKQRPNYINGTYDAMRLSLHEDGGKYSVAEELFINNLIELGQLALDKRFPGFKGFRDGHPVFTKVAHNLNLANRISNATKVFMNELRADMADDAAALWTMKSGEMTAAESRILGKTVNAFTGKGDMSLIGMDGQKAQSALSKVLISAPWLMSRLQLMALHPLWSKGSTGESRKAAAEIYVDMAAGVAAYYGAFVLAGMFMSDDDDERPVVEWDSTSSDFMKVRIGKTRLDPLFGLQQVIVLTSRILHDEIKDSHGVVRPRKVFEDDWALISRFQEGRLHPAIQDIRSLKTGKDFMGNPITKTEVAIGAITPITYPDIVKASENRGVPASTAIAIWAMAGGGLATYDPRTKARADIVEELGIVQRKIQNQNTPADVRKSLQTDADKMLEEHLLNAVKHDMSYRGNTVVSEQLATREPGTPIAPELSEAIQKEKHDIALRALEMLSTEDTKKEKKPGEDSGITTARSLLRTLAPTYDEANALFEAAYKQRNGALKELVGEKGHKRWQFKPSVTAARRRMKAIYETK